MKSLTALIACLPLALAANCPFCDDAILQAQTFYENTLVRALYTHRPIVPAHFLIIPKRHIERFEELTQQEFVQMQDTLHKVNQMSQKVFGTYPYFIHQKNGVEVGQSVPHVHFHYIGKQEQDSSTLKFVYHLIRSQLAAPLSKEQLQEMTHLLKASIEP